MNAQARLKKVREKTGLNINSFSSKLGVHQSNISAIENETKDVSKSIAIKLKENFNVSIDWLLTGEGSMFLDEKDSTVSIQNNITKSKNSSINNNLNNNKPMTLAERHKANMDSDAISIYEMSQKFSGGKFDTNEFLEIFNKISEQAKETIRHKDELLKSKDEIIKSKDEYIELLKTQIEKGK